MMLKKFKFVTIIIILFISIINIQPKIISKDELRDLGQLIESRGFISETHSITTDDGYILKVFRIVNPFLRNNSNPLRPVLLQHGFLASGSVFLMNSEGELLDNGTYVENGGKIINNCNTDLNNEIDYVTHGNVSETTGRTLGFVLSACGYDVWLGNSRGNSYSDKHKILNKLLPKFWEFSFSKMGKYDLTAVVNYVLKVTKRSTIGYIGHSQGTTQMFAELSSNPAFGKKINPFIALAPVVYTNNVGSLFKTLATILESPSRIYRGPIGDKSSPLSVLVNDLLCLTGFQRSICGSLSIGGYDPPQVNKSRINTYRANADISSSWCVSHYFQEMNKKVFANFDYGSNLLNIQHYGRSKPPEYNIETINSPNIALFYGASDTLADPDDVELFKSKLKVPLLDDYRVELEDWNHDDFLIAMDTSKYINPRILKLLKNVK